MNNKKLSIDLFFKYPKLAKIEFYKYRKPTKNDHILSRLRFKNDAVKIRAGFYFEGNFTSYQTFYSINEIEWSLNYMTAIVEMSTGSSGNTFGNKSPSWDDMEIITFCRKDLEKYLVIK